MKVPAAEALHAAEARALAADALPAELAFSTDTRTLRPGDAYVALRGERFDGHDFIAPALAAGAVALVVDREAAVPVGVPALVVADTAKAYLAFGAVARRRSSARFVAITGSAGKTTTKAFLAHLLECAAPGRTLATPSNENNEIGVAKLLLGLGGGERYVTVEFGARHYGEIAPLALAARPETAVLTNIGEAHLEVFGSRERLAETKWGIFASGARRVTGAGDSTSRDLAARDRVAATWFGIDDDPPAPPGEASVVLAGRTELRVAAPAAAPRAFPVRVGVPGEHNLRNVAAAAAAAIDLGLEPELVAANLATLELPAGRYERTSAGAFDVVYDAYNANPSGVRATLASFATERGERRIAVLGSMAELGADAAAMHRAAGADAAAARLDALLVGGEFADDLARGAREAGMPAERIVAFADNAAAAAWLRANGRPGDVVLLKGSRKYRLEEILTELRGAHAG